MAFCAQSYGIFCLFTIQTVLIICVSTPTDGTHLFPQHYTMIHWAGRIEKELEKVLQHVTGTQQMRSIYNEKKSQFEIKKNNPRDLVERVARDISKLLNSKRKALEKLAREAELLQKEHVWQDGVTRMLATDDDHCRLTEGGVTRSATHRNRDTRLDERKDRDCGDWRKTCTFHQIVMWQLLLEMQSLPERERGREGEREREGGSRAQGLHSEPTETCDQPQQMAVLPWGLLRGSWWPRTRPHGATSSVRVGVVCVRAYAVLPHRTMTTAPPVRASQSLWCP
ncbi:Voltage-dependent calcium channel subunit alpha-2/delta-2 [Larimichthys crocea]|uniref:Uncharacterized protein n=1 Tax=Larimichthys crocea TaxID=215358 RepID=A0ACD3RI16_LARCR|nr:Voltage-dependent calcium channel subunit alpha-2/delta-2 [Larimichthys crocea]